MESLRRHPRPGVAALAAYSGTASMFRYSRGGYDADGRGSARVADACARAAGGLLRRKTYPDARSNWGVLYRGQDSFASLAQRAGIAVAATACEAFASAGLLTAGAARDVTLGAARSAGESPAAGGAFVVARTTRGALTAAAFGSAATDGGRFLAGVFMVGCPANRCASWRCWGVAAKCGSAAATRSVAVGAALMPPAPPLKLVRLVAAMLATGSR